ncbi:MAG: tetratricopeptide repeat protein [Gammaproteobacteria bacterium]|nr:tetratricopeptide repeat protein [Gammaproteobacteria bacterium]
MEVPQEADPWFRLGNIYARLEQPGKAVAAYQEALVRKPENGKAWHNMGIVQLRQAMNSFMHLEAATEPGDPLHDRARIMLDTVSQVLESDFDAAPGEPVR